MPLGGMVGVLLGFEDQGLDGGFGWENGVLDWGNALEGVVPKREG